MRKTIKKILMETIKDKKLQMAYVYLSNYMMTQEEVEEVVDYYGYDTKVIYLREPRPSYRNPYTMVSISKEYSECWVGREFWREFSDYFSLNATETQLVITKWVEDTYGLKGIHTRAFE